MPQNHLNRSPHRLLVILLSLIMAGCGSSERVLGPRPALDLNSVVEAYLQQYQPGPLPRLFQTTFVYDRNGALLAELISEGRREWVTYNQVSPHLINATIATEDSTFFTNPGIDPVRIAGAALQNVEQGEIVSGASTITMQLARNLFLGPEDRYDQTFDRKIVEAGLAAELTQTYAKEELLEMYFNLLNYGALAYGPQAAARTYFGKSAADLTLAEATLLAGIPQAPALYNLFENLESAKKRQRIVLSLMVRHALLTQAEADAVFATAVDVNGSAALPEIRAPHFVDFVVSELDEQLREGYVRRGGLRIYTTLDLALQEAAQRIVSEKVAALGPTYDMDNGALIALKPGTAEILAMVGSADYYDTEIDGQVNVTIRLRQPGSSIKPLLYATAINDNVISPATVLWDTPISYTVSGQEDYKPLNYDRKLHGPVTARAALANSYNIPAVKLLSAVGVERMLESARKMGVHSLSRGAEWYGLSLTLGGGEVTLLDLASAYHTMANSGRYLAPRYLLTITDGRGLNLLDDAAPVSVAALTEDAAALITDILSDNPAREPMFGPYSPLVLDRPVAAKTGTTDNNRDAWTMGYTRYLLAGVWVGNTDGRPMRNATGAAAAAPIWNEFMRSVLSEPALLAVLDAPQADDSWAFAISDGVERLDACPPGLTCRQGGGELFSAAWLEAASLDDQENQDGQENGDGQENRDGQDDQINRTGPLADSVVNLSSAPVYVKQQAEGGLETRLLGYCAYAEGAVRSLLALPDPFGLPHVAEDPAADAPPDDSLQRDRMAALTWNLGASFPVYVGPCEEMDRLAAETGLAIGIDLANAGATDSADTVTEGDLVDVTSPIATGAYLYFLERLWHGDQCPGEYIMGTALDHRGDAAPDVHIRLIDAWGNSYQTVSKSGSNDAGRFDFPIYSGSSPQNLTLQALDSDGNPLSPTIFIPHRTDETSDMPCHYVVVRRR